MKKLYFLDEQEKERILNLHTEATKQQYLVNKKILNEGPIPNLNLSRLTGLSKFLLGGKYKGTSLQKYIDAATHNALVLKSVDDILEDIPTGMFVGGSKTNKDLFGFQTSTGNLYTIDMLANDIAKSFKPDKVPTQQEINNFKNQILPTINLKNNNGTGIVFDDVLTSKIEKNVKDKWWKNNLPKGSNILGSANNTLVNLPKWKKRTGLTLLGLGTILAAIKILENTRIIKTSLGKSELLLDSIERFCSVFTVEELNSFVQTGNQTEIKAREFITNIKAATSSSWYTLKNDTTQAINGLPPDIETFCTAMKILPSDSRTQAILTKKTTYIGYNFVLLMHYHYKGGYAPWEWEFDNYQHYVIDPILTKFNKVAKMTDKKLKEYQNVDPTVNPDYTKGTGTPTPVVDCSTTGTIECLKNNYIDWRSENINCVLEECKKAGKTCIVFNNKTENTGYIQIDKFAYFNNFTFAEIGKDIAGASYTTKFYCNNNKIVRD